MSSLYVLLIQTRIWNTLCYPAEIFDKVQHVFYDANPLTIEEQRALLVQVGLSVGWDDPEMDVYNELDPH